MDDDLVLAFFKTLKRFTETSIQSIEINANNCPPLVADFKTMNSYLADLLKCKICASELLLHDSVIFERVQASRLKPIIRSASHCFVTAETVNIELLSESAFAAYGSMVALYMELNPDKDFGKETHETFTNLIEPTGSPAVKALDKFAKIGILMSKDPQFKSSLTGKLEDFIIDPTSTYNSEIESQKTDASVVASARQTGIEFANSFVAIVAPSMEGKTQSAFSFQRIRPLYFPLSGTDIASAASQDIYLNFKSLSAMLTRCAKKDSFDLPFNVTTHYLKTNHIQTKFWTLGFLKALVEKAKTVADLSGHPWLKYFALQDSFTFEKFSLAELDKNFFDGFCLFLDEFGEGWWNDFLRNLARATGMICIVSNTNSKISGLVGRDRSSGGSGTLYAWSLVVTKLNYASLSILQDSYDEFGLAVSKILSSSKVTDSVKSRLSFYLETEIGQLRPGVALFVAEGLVDFAGLLDDRQTICNLGEFMLAICNFVLFKLKFRKPRLFSSTQSFLAKFGMLYPEAFQSVTASMLAQSTLATNRDAGLRELANQRSYIEDHLFYVSNPSSDRKCFCTYPPRESNDRVKYLQVIDEEAQTLIDWKHELTFLYATEIFTILTCTLVSIPTSVTNLINTDLQRRPESIFNAVNSEILSNSIEACAAALICESSRYGHDSKSFSFKGFDGLNLARNMIYHLLQAPSENQEIDLENSPEHLKALLRGCRIPFLTSVNQDPPLQAMPAEDFCLGTYKRGANLQEIEGLFNFRLGNEELVASCECKNYFNTVNSNQLQESLEKAKNAKARLCLVVATQFSENPQDYFFHFCLDNHINLYRVRKETYDPNKPANFTSFAIEEMFVHEEAELYALLFEIRLINKLD